MMAELPPGFTLDSQAPQGGPPPLPPGFTLDGTPATSGEEVHLEPGERVLNVGGPNKAVVPHEDAGAGVAAVRGARQGVTGNFGDELSGLAAASPLPGQNPNLPNIGALDVLAGGARLAAENIAPSWFGTGGHEARDAKVAQERAANEEAAAAHPVANIAGQIGGGLIASPLIGPMGGGVAGAAKTGALFGGIYGAGAGTDIPSRATGALGGAAVGGAGGAALGAALAPFTRPAASNAVVEAADRLGVSVPKAVASDGRIMQMTGATLKNVPFSGDPLQKGAETTVKQLGQKASDIAGQYGGANAEQAGQAVGTGITNWIGGGSRKVADRLYTAVDQAVAPNAGMMHPLPETQGAVAKIMARDVNAARPGMSGAVQDVKDAITRPGGLNYEGIKDLRTRIGTATSDLLTKNADKGDYDQLYRALTKDLENAVQRSGGKDAVQKWQKANELYSQISDRREALAKIVGTKGQASDAQIFDRILSAAGVRSRANTELLTQARKTVGHDAWNEIAAATVSRLGRDVEGKFSPERFLTAYGNLSPEGKTLLFRSTGKADLARALDDIATVSSRFKELQKYANPSGTARNASFVLIGGALWAEPVTTITSIVGGNIAARILASPATASSMARWSNAYFAFVKAPTIGTLTGLRIASRNFGSTVADKLGVPALGDRLFGAVTSHATGQQQEAPRPGN
jgi:hypothetical protein